MYFSSRYCRYISARVLDMGTLWEYLYLIDKIDCYVENNFVLGLFLGGIKFVLLMSDHCCSC